MDLIYKRESYKIIGAAMEVHRELGHGFLETVYQEAFELELQRKNIPYVREKLLTILYKGVELEKRYKADFVCFETIIVETKATKQLTGVDESQVINYLNATSLKLGILINFGAESLEYKRLVHF